MVVFEFTSTQHNNRRILVIGEAYRAYEKEDGSVLLNDEKAGYSYHPRESYEVFRRQFANHLIL